MAIVTAIAMVATAAMSAMSSRQQGKAMEQKANAQARVVEQQARISAANDRMEGANALARANMIAAAQAAQAGASGFSSGIGSLGAAMQLNTLRAGLEDMQSFQTNSMLAIAMGHQNALDIRWGGKVAKQQANMEALTTMTKAVGSYGQMGGFTSEFYGTGTG
jgi:regulator of protease activity HflC (stomatin/prohibitin superfamily)